MLRNSRLVIRIVVILLFAIVGHEALMIGAHAAAHVEPPTRSTSHHAHDRVAESGGSSASSIRHGDNGDCVPGHEFVRRVDEAPVDSGHTGAATATALATSEDAASRLANGEAPGRPPAQIRALLQVFLN